MKLSSRQTAVIASLAAFSAALQLIHLGYRSPQWGMWLDLVAVSWIVALLLYGRKTALTVALLVALVITLFSPDTWLGASMKLVATLPLILFFSVKPGRLVISAILAVGLRLLVVLPLNYYYAIPIWTGMAPAAAMKVIPWWVIAGFNLVQSLIDLSLAWLIVFRFKLSRYARN